jgi:hypothetical protein
MTIGYRITIKRIETATETVRGEWVKTGEKEEKGEYSETIKWVPTYAYAPSFEKETTRESVLLEQNVQSLDMAAVIKAVNQL